MASSSPSPVQPAPEPPVPESMTVPELLQIGTPLTKVSSTSKHKKLVFRIDPDQGQISWDSKSHKIIPIEAIKELRCGADARYDREQFQLSPEYEDRWITIIYILDGEYKALHLIAPTKDVYNMWQITLHKLYAIRQELMAGLGNLEMRQTLWEKHYWKSSDEERDQKLEFSEVEKLCKRLNINTNSENLLRLFNATDVRKRNYLDFQDFRRFVKLLKARPEVDRLYKQIKAKSKDVFDYDAFEMFMHDKQLTTLTRPEIQALFAKYTRPSETPESPIQSPSAAPSSETSSLTPVDPTAVIMTPDAFASFLLSNDNSALIDSNRNIWQDMTRPLSEYYVSSSHNTYLVGHQLVGVSTTEGYIRALLHSCRSVELDIYDGDKEPMIFHGKTLTSKVSLREVCEAIKKYGFVSSPYPVIISAEIHCGIPQQEQMVDIMISVFGDALVQAPVDARPIITVLPSPEELKGRILLKAKNLLISRTQSRPPGDSGVVEVSASSASDSDMMHEVKEEWDYAKKREAEAVKGMQLSFSSCPELNGLLEIRGIMERVRGRGKSNPPVNGGPRSSEAGKTKPKMSFALVALLVYTVGVKCRGINKKEEYAPEHMFSLSETTANKMLKTNMIDLIKHARTHMVRIYPKGLRLNSTNYEPHRYWSGGAQLVALNWQTFDLGYMINHAMFQRNGRAGYVLKPPALRLNQKELLGKRTDHFLDVTVISAQQLPQPKDSSWRDILDRSMIDPYVEVSVHVPDWTVAPDGTHVGLTADVEGPPSATAACTHTYRTSVVKNNGFNPVWEEKLRIPFTCVGDMKDLIFVRFTVKQGDKDDDEPLAVFCASLGSLQSGYRHLPLHDAQLSQYLFATLFVRIHIHDIL
ncbi:PLC-like phosphodiesterase [Mycena floridula]|nr:PLC-like phosphodiesterase [Mycena floridula]